ncbi:PKD domain-containing protein [Halobellus sp. GM3]|uniref:PKD domain-containing protein n=1 Tax=Halobellus sp. GM3 TaxID=3458410 RepID=UPI00403D8902
MTVQFDGSNTTDNVGVSTYNWTFGDGSNTTGEKPSHTYGSPGTYTVTLNASDSAGNYDTDTLTVIVEEVSSGSSGSGSSSSSSDEEPEIEETTVTVDQSSEEDEETGTDDAESDSTTESSWSVTVSNARADQSVDISFEEPETDETDATDTDDAATDDTESDETIQPNIRVPRIRMNIATDGDFTLDVTTRERGQPIGTDNGDSETPTGTDAGGSDTLTESSQSQSASSLDGLSEADREFARGTGSRAIGEVTVDHSIPDEDIEDVTFTFRVGKSYLDRSGVSAESVGLYRDETVRWNALPTTLVDETDSEYVFEATSPGLSVFTVGSIQPLYEVTDSRVSKTSLATGESVDVTLTVANRGGEAGNYTAALTADGEVVTSETVFIDAQSDTTLTLSPAFDAAGDYNLRVGQQSVGSVAVGGGSDADSGGSDVGSGGSDADSDGNALIVVLLFATLGGTVVALWYRRQ